MNEAPIPFIGDTYSLHEKIFKGTCIKDTSSLSVTDFKYEDKKFEIELNLCSVIDTDLEDANGHVIIGIDIELPTEEEVILQGSIVANVHGGKKFTKNVPVNVIYGKVKIIQYKLLPVDLLSVLAVNVMNAEAKNEDGKPKFDPRKLEKIKIFQELNACLQEADEILNRENNKLVLTTDERNVLKLLKTVLFECKENFFLDGFNFTQELNSFNWTNKMYTLVMRIENCRILTKSRWDYLKNLQTVHMEKIKFIQRLIDIGLAYVYEIETLESLLKSENCFVLFYTDDLAKNDPARFECVLEFLDNFIAKNVKMSVPFLAVNMGVVEGMNFPLPEKVSVYHFYKKNLKSMDLIKDVNRKKNLNLAKCVNEGIKGEELQRRGKFVMPCPNSGTCSSTFQEWTCCDCEANFDYGFNNRLYCKCANGKGILLENFEFRCSNPNHGFYYVKFNAKCQEYLNKIDPLEHTLENVSVLVIGLEGNKKTDWINDVINYISFEDIDQARKFKIVAAKPANVCQTYNVRYKYCNVRLIDTPDLGGIVDENREKVKNIIKYVTEMNELHGVCFLLKPDDLNLDLTTRYCVKELLAHLHRSCAGNVVFCFQNSKAPFYPDKSDKYPVLKKVLEEFEESLRIDESKIYCFDCELRNRLENILRSAKDHDWVESVEESRRLFDHVISIPPHKTGGTSDLNKNKNKILELAEPMDQVIRLIELNISALSFLLIIRENCAALSDLLGKHSDSFTVDDIMGLDNPIRIYPEKICSANCCIEYTSQKYNNNTVVPYNNGYSSSLYENNCVNRCTLPECRMQQQNDRLSGLTAVRNRRSRSKYRDVCINKTHVKIDCDSNNRMDIKLKDNFLNINIDGCLSEKGAGNVNLGNQITDLSNEKKRMIESIGKFTYFLTKEAVIGYNDCLLDYLNRTGELSFKEKEIKFFEMGRANIIAHGKYESLDFGQLMKELYDIPVYGKQVQEYLQNLELSKKTCIHQLQKIGAQKKRPF